MTLIGSRLYACGRVLLTALLVCAPLLACAPPLAAQAPDPAAGAEKVHIVMLFGSPDVNLWAQQFSTAFFRNRRLAEHDPPVSTTTEFLNLYQADSEGFEQILDLLRYKQRTDPADVVVAVLGVAAQFLADHGEDIYPQAERLYVLPGQELAKSLRTRPENYMLTSVMREAILGTAQIVPQVMPRVERLLVISGANPLDDIYHAHAQAALSGREDTLVVEYLHARPFEEVQQRLADAPPNTAALMLTYESDPAGNVYRNSVDVMPRLAEVSAVPIFVVYDTLLGTGGAGGVMTSTSRYGEVAADMALAAAKGQPVTTDLDATTRTAFDGQVLEHHGIAVGRLPPGSELINYVEPVYVTYAKEIAAAGAIMLVQLVLIVALLRVSRQRKRTARALNDQARDLERQKVRFESVVNSVPDALVITSNDGTIAHTNRHGFSATFGHDPEQVIGCAIGELAADDGLPSLEVTRAHETATHAFLEASGRTFPGEWTATRILADTGEHLGYVLVIRDISERIAVEEERRHAHKMEALGNLAGGIAHDFNNVLAVILGNAELMRSSGDPSPERLDQIVLASARARDLVRQILAFSRKDESRHELKNVDLRALLQESAGFLKASLPSTISVELCLPERIDATVHGDEGQLQQVLINLSTNARDAMGEAGGEITIRASNIRAQRPLVVSHGVAPAGELVCIEISDSGPGMDADLQKRAFEPFFTTKGPGEGTGMGLALVYGIIQAHGGGIDLQSVRGRGCRFALYLPVVESRASVSADPVEPGGAGTGQRVLLVEDEQAVLAMAEAMLRRLGYAVEAYEHPRKALDAFERSPERYDVVVTDRTMPQLDGLRLARALREGGAMVPLVICSGYSEPVDAEQLDVLRPINLLAKPYRVADLATAVRRALAAASQTDKRPGAA